MSTNDTGWLRQAIDERNAEYAAALDGRRFDEWPEFFTPAGRYRLQARENFERGLPLALMALDGQGMMKDRVYGITQTIYHQPYYTRHVVGVARLLDATDASGGSGGVIRSESAYAVFRTKPASVSEVFNVGRYVDEWVHLDGVLRLRSRLCIYDSELVLNSLIYPI